MRAFGIISVCGKARAGVLHTVHGAIETPFFMPVATKGSVKYLSNEEVAGIGISCLISNAFILHLKPGLDVIEKHGGLHEFMNWQKGIFTDSGGFQVLSSDFCLKLVEQGVWFRNPFDGKKMLFTPEKAIEIENLLGSDVAMCLDDVPLAGSCLNRLSDSVERTFAWAKRCKAAHKNRNQLLFGISQGGVEKKLRLKSTEQIVSLDFDGIALGGLCIGEPKQKMHETIKAALQKIPDEKSRYLMGVGSAREIIESVSMGIDIFDSCFPTRVARHGMAFAFEKNINIESSKYRLDLAPLEKKCNCFVCRDYSRSYLHHLYRSKEENALKYLSYHNLFFIQSLLSEIRTAIKEKSFKKEKFLKKFGN
jgi:queuine tRNA-ribosyltransferase